MIDVFRPTFCGLVCSIVFALASASLAVAQSPGPLQGKLFGNRGGSILVVTLHGDLSSGANAEYQYDIAERIASAAPNVLAFGLIRPGYMDDSGLKSKGSNNNRRDNYTARNNKLVADTIANLRAETNVEHVIALGHSGGAAQLGVIIGRFPGLIDSVVLVSCPCDLAKRSRMHGHSFKGKSQSPNRFAARVPSTTRVIAVTGANDDNTFPVLAYDYVAKLTKRGATAQFIEVPAAGHNYGSALRRVAESAVEQEIKRLR